MGFPPAGNPGTAPGRFPVREGFTLICGSARLPGHRGTRGAIQQQNGKTGIKNYLGCKNTSPKLPQTTFQPQVSPCLQHLAPPPCTEWGRTVWAAALPYKQPDVGSEGLLPLAKLWLREWREPGPRAWIWHHQGHSCPSSVGSFECHNVRRI